MTEHATTAPIVPAHVSPWGDSGASRAWDRAAVLAAIEEATGEDLAVSDPLPDSLIAQAQALGLAPVELRLWIYDDPHREEWTMEALAVGARRDEH